MDDRRSLHSTSVANDSSTTQLLVGVTSVPVIFKSGAMSAQPRANEFRDADNKHKMLKKAGIEIFIFVSLRTMMTTFDQNTPFSFSQEEDCRLLRNRNRRTFVQLNQRRV